MPASPTSDSPSRQAGSASRSGSLARATLGIAVGVAILLAWASAGVAAEDDHNQQIGRDRPIYRALPRAEVYPRLARELGVDAAAAKSLLLPLEERGLFLRDAVHVLVLAKVRLDQLVEAGEVPKDRSLPDALRASADHLLSVVEKGGGWATLTREAKAKQDLRVYRTTANAIIGLTATRQGVETRTGSAATATRAPIPQPPTKRRVVRQPDVQAEPSLPREVVEKNLAAELGLDEATTKALLAEVAVEMPLREAVLLMVVAKTVAEKRVERGEFTKEQWREAVTKTVETLLPLAEEGTGWGDVGGRVGVPLAVRMGLMHNQANKILGQR